MDIEKILENHKIWVETGGKQGVRANLNGADLTGAVLTGACLHGAVLWRADFHGACLHGANLRGADLYGAKGILQWQAPIGEKRLCYSVKHEGFVMHQLGCFWGTTDEAVEAIRKKYGEGSLYEEVLALMAKCLESE
jgi:hypothetical protein